MAIYHLHAQVISRGKGRSAIAAAAYRAAEKIHDDRLGRDHSYENKQGVEHKEILAPENAPAWVHDRHQLWNHVEAAENRKDAQVAREVLVALPTELTNDQQLELVREFVGEQFVKKGMVADFAIHRDNPQNPHVHIMLTTRTIGPEGFGQKERAWNAKEVLVDWREGWADAVNHHLYLAGQHIHVDHRSFEAQGIRLEPGIKLGVNEERRGKDGRDIIAERMAEHDRIVRENGEAILRDPQLALDAITHQRATFTRQDVGRWLNTHTADAEQFQEALDRVMVSPALVAIGKDAKGRDRYTTREMLEVERRMVDSAQAMAERQGHEVSARHQEQGERIAKLSADQRRAFDHIMQPADVAVVQGYAGAGKSFMLGAAREAWEAEGYNVKGGALAGKAAEGLQISAGITSRSLHAWEHAWSQGYERLTSKDVLVIDEAGMVGSRQLGRVLDHARAAGAKVVLVGDTRQLQAIEAGAPMRMIGERVGQVTMEDIRRQKDAAQKKSSELLAQGEVSQVLSAYERIGRVHEHQTQEEARATIVKDWARHRRLHPDEVQIMLAFKRDDVLALNLVAREKMREAGVLRGKDQRVETPQGPRDFAIGDRIYFTKNDRQLGVLNGSLGTLEAGRGPAVTVRLDDGRRVAFDVREYNHLDHGYAATVHKAQGVTVDRAHVLADSHFDQHVAYVALTRHRDEMDLHWSREEFADEAKMHAVLGRERMKDVAVDYEKTVVDNRRLEVEAQAQERTAPKPQPEKTPTRVDGAALAASLDDLLETLAARETQEARGGSMLRRSMLDQGPLDPDAPAAKGPNPLRAAATKAIAERAQSEKELADRFGVRPPPVGAAPRADRESPGERLAAWERRSARAAEAWFAWRDRAPADQVLAARKGEGPGAKLLVDFRSTRAWAQEASKAFQENRHALTQAPAQARVDKREKELDRQLDLEDRVSTPKQKAATRQRPEPEAPQNPFAGRPLYQLEAMEQNAKALIKAGPVDVKKTASQQHDYMKAVEFCDHHAQQHEWWREQVVKFEREHPIKARMRTAIPKGYDRYLGHEISIYDGEKLSSQRLKQAEQEKVALVRDPAFQARVHAAVDHHNAELAAARCDLPLIEKALPAARMEHDKRVQEIEREQQLDKELDRGGRGLGGIER